MEGIARGVCLSFHLVVNNPEQMEVKLLIPSGSKIPLVVRNTSIYGASSLTESETNSF